MSATYHIHLEPQDKISENRIVQTRAKTVATYTLPRGCRRVVIYNNGGGRGSLELGGFSSISVSVKGDLDVLARLREAVL